MKRLYILHGYGATSHDHWFEWLASKFNTEQIKVTVPDFPNSSHPDVQDWQATLRSVVGLVDKDTYFVAHSLAGVNLLRYLNSLESRKVGGIIFVSGFIRQLKVLPEINPFSLNEVKALHSSYLEVIASIDDQIVPYEYSKELASLIGATLTSYDNAGHFLASDGYVRFPELYEKVEKMLLQTAV